MKKMKTSPEMIAALNLIAKGEFTHPGLTDSQGNQVTFKLTPTSWGGMLLKPEGDYGCFTMDAWKCFLAWAVGK